MLGAAYATLAGFILLMVLRTWNAQRVFPVAYQWRRVVVILLAAGLLTVIGEALPHSLLLAVPLRPCIRSRSRRSASTCRPSGSGCGDCFRPITRLARMSGEGTAVVVEVAWVNGLAAIRSLGRKGLRVLAVDHRSFALGLRSRYAEARIAPEPARRRGRLHRRAAGDRARRPTTSSPSSRPTTSI